MTALLRILRSRRGDLLVDAVVGAVVSALIMGTTAAILLVSGQISVAQANDTARLVALTSVANSSIPTASALPATSDDEVMDKKLAVSVWADTSDDRLVRSVFAATTKYGHEDAVCTEAAAPSSKECLVAKVSVDDSIGGVDVMTFDLQESSTGAWQTTTDVPSDVTELRYVFKVLEAPKDDETLTFSNDSGGSYDVRVPAGATGYFYGSVRTGDTDTSTSITVKAPKLSLDESAFALYAAPASLPAAPNVEDSP